MNKKSADIKDKTPKFISEKGITKEKNNIRRNKKTRHGRLIPRIVYLIALISSAIYVSNQGGGLSYVLFFSILLYIPVAFLQIVMTRVALRIYQDVGDRILYKNSAVPYQVTVSNAWIFPLGNVRLIKAKEVTDFEDDFTGEIYNFLPFENKIIETKMSCKYAGSYVEGIEKIQISDIFGIMYITYDIPAPLRVYVLPSITDVAYTDINRVFEEMADKRNRFRSERDDISLGNDTRKYMPGDSINSVHWKNYARSRELFVRLPDKQDTEMLTVVMMPYKKTDIVTRDYMLEFIVSAVNYFVKQSKPIKVIYYCAGIQDVLIENHDSFRSFYMDKMRVLGTSGKEIPEGAYDKLEETARKAGGAVAFFYEEDGRLTGA